MDIERAVKHKRQKDAVKITAEILIVIALAIIVAGAINSSFFLTTRVAGHSMDDTLYGGGDDSVKQNTFFDRIFFGPPDENGDKVLLIKSKNIKRGDLIVFYQHRANGEREQWIKRVIGVGGDKIRIFNGKVYLNGSQLSEDYVKGATYPAKAEITVPEGCVYVMGDNRANSTDSRIIGCVKLEDLVGRVALVIKKDTKKIVLPKKL